MKTIKWLFFVTLSLAIPVLLVRFAKKPDATSETDRRYDINDYLTEVGL